MLHIPGKTLFLVGLGVVLGLALARLPEPSATGQAARGKGEEGGQVVGKAGGPNPATETTKKHNVDFAKTLPFKDTRDFEFAKKGLIAPLPAGGVVKNAGGQVVWDPRAYSFITLDQDAPDTVNPSLWRQAQVLSINGLFKVTDHIYQVRGYDLSNITFIEGTDGVTVVDPLISQETAKAALDLYYRHRPKKPVVAVIYTHSHVDHFGGVRGVVDGKDVKAGKVRIIAPEHFTEEAVSENVIAGNVMNRRAVYMYGRLLPKSPQGQVTSGLGLTTSTGQMTLIRPTEFVKMTGEKRTIDGLTYEFLMAPGSEAPAEMHFFIPEHKALCTAENACHTMHNLYTLRGAKTRDARKWSGYLTESLDLWGGKAEVLFAPHHWPVWGNEAIVDHVKKYRDTFKYIHDQTLRLANHGYTMIEIAEMMKLPPSLEANWASRGYYGSLNHNVKAVYNFYLGWFNANPATLHELPPAAAAKRYVEYMGGADAVLARAKKDFARGEYRWVAQVVNQVVLADPGNRAARNLQADALEQLGYQAENGTWRCFYLQGAQELRDGVTKAPVANSASADIVRAMPLDLFFDYLAVRLNGRQANGKKATINMDFTDTKEQYVVTLDNSVLNYAKGKQATDADCTVTLTRSGLDDIILGRAKLPQQITAGDIKIAGNARALQEVLSLLDSFDFWFDVVTANPPPRK
jgi:alkyl sulfatase BDS1-like metallo-beta-lactamase superfamily hydrolase